MKKCSNCEKVGEREKNIRGEMREKIVIIFK
jgi:hypothetical protein